MNPSAIKRIDNLSQRLVAKICILAYLYRMKSKKEIRSVEIYAGTHWEVELLKSLLENENIGAYLKDGIIGTTFPFHAAPGAANPVKLVVSSTDYDKALIVLQEFKLKA